MFCIFVQSYCSGVCATYFNAQRYCNGFVLCIQLHRVIAVVVEPCIQLHRCIAMVPVPCIQLHGGIIAIVYIYRFAYMFVLSYCSCVYIVYLHIMLSMLSTGGKCSDKKNEYSPPAPANAKKTFAVSTTGDNVDQWYICNSGFADSNNKFVDMNDCTCASWNSPRTTTLGDCSGWCI